MNGQSIIEVIIIALIISIALASSFGLFSQFYSSNQFRGEQITANYLAVEGIELVRNYMDVNRAQDPTALFNKGLDQCGSDGKGCLIDINTNHSNNTPTIVNPSTNLYLYIDPSNFYVNNAGANNSITPFSRKIYVTPVSSGDNQNNAYEIISQVDWQTRSGPIEIKLKTYIYAQ